MSARHAVALAMIAFVLAPPRPQAQTRAPVGRSGAAMVYDAARREMVLWGGIAPDGRTFPTELWSWNGTSWRTLVPADGNAPSGRSFHTLAYDETRHRIVMFGGRRDGLNAGDVWEWDGSRWHEILHSGESILHAAVGFDPVRRRIASFGGLNQRGILHKTSDWDGRGWRIRDSAGPPEFTTLGAALAFTTSGEMIVVTTQSGSSSDSVAMLTWSWTGTSWTRHETGPPMTSLQPTASAPDGTIYIYQKAGEWLTRPLVHTRTPAGKWTSVSPAVHPPTGGAPAAAYDPVRHRFVIYDTDYWEWDGRQWHRINR